MSKHVEAEYERLEKDFMKVYGTVHTCGNCLYTTTCIRMKIQHSRVSEKVKQEMMAKLAPFVTVFDIENYKPNNCVKVMQFIKVYKCERFKFDRGGTKDGV